jgi:two-component system response regulator DesR
VNQTPIRVLCVDDNELVAQAVERRIAFEPRFQWVGWVPRSEQLAETVATSRPHVVLLDIDMPGRSVFEVVRELAESSPETRVVMFSGYVRNDYIDRAVEAGAWGYISKNASIEELLEAIQKVADGHFALTEEAMMQQVRAARPADAGPPIQAMDAAAES